MVGGPLWRVPEIYANMFPAYNMGYIVFFLAIWGNMLGTTARLPSQIFPLKMEDSLQLSYEQ